MRLTRYLFIGLAWLTTVSLAAAQPPERLPSMPRTVPQERIPVQGEPVPVMPAPIESAPHPSVAEPLRAVPHEAVAPTMWTHEHHFSPQELERLERRRRQQARILGYPEEFCEPPLGHFLGLHMRAQVRSGLAARMALYHYDFHYGTAELNFRGRRRLGFIAGHLPKNFFPVLIESTYGDPELDEARRASVLQALNEGSFPIPAERVLVGPPPTKPLDGVDALGIYDLLQREVRIGGSPLFLGGGLPGAPPGGAMPAPR